MGYIVCKEIKLSNKIRQQEYRYEIFYRNSYRQNGVIKKQETYVTTYYLDKQLILPFNKSSLLDNNKDLENKIVNAVDRCITRRVEKENKRKEIFDWWINKFDEISLQYYPDDNSKKMNLRLNVVQRSNGVKGDDGGDKPTTYFGIVRETKETAVLVETCFISTDDEVKKVDELHEQKIAGEAIGMGIVKAYGLKEKALPKPVKPEKPNTISVEEYNKVRSDLSNALNDISKYESKIEMLKLNADKLRNDYNALINEKNTLDKNVEDLNIQLTEKDKVINEFKVEIEGLDIVIETHEKEIKQLNDELVLKADVKEISVSEAMSVLFKAIKKIFEK